MQITPSFIPFLVSYSLSLDWYSVKYLINDFGDLTGEFYWDGVPNLMKLCCLWTLKNIILGKGLEECGFSCGERPTLGWIRMNEIVAIFGNMTDDRGTGSVPTLTAEAVIEFA